MLPHTAYKEKDLTIIDVAVVISSVMFVQSLGRHANALSGKNIDYMTVLIRWQHDVGQAVRRKRKDNDCRQCWNNSLTDTIVTMSYGDMSVMEICGVKNAPNAPML